MSNNVILFPKSKLSNIPVQSLDEIFSNINEARKEQIEYIVDEVTTSVIEIAAECGFNLTDTKVIKSTAFFTEALRSAFLHANGIEHPLQKIVDKFDIETK